MSPTQTPPVHCQNPRRLVRVLTLRPSRSVEGLGCREYSFEAHLCGSYVHCDLPVRFRACSPPRLAATQLARSSVLNRLIAPAGLSPALTPASRAHQRLNLTKCKRSPGELEQTPSLPDAGPNSDRPRCGRRESKFLADRRFTQMYADSQRDIEVHLGKSVSICVNLRIKLFNFLLRQINDSGH
jgi:hypothetical protein